LRGIKGIRARISRNLRLQTAETGGPTLASAPV
jgi:hypothetical protein